MTSHLSRRNFLRTASLGAAGAFIAARAPQDAFAQEVMIERAKKYVKESKKDAKRKPKYKDKEVFEGMLAEGEALLKETKRTKEVK